MRTYLNSRHALLVVAFCLTFAAVGCQAPPRREPVLSAFAMTDVRLVEKKHWGEGFTPADNYTGDCSGRYELKDTLRGLYRKYCCTPESSTVLRSTQRDKIAYIFLTLIKHYHDGTTDDVYELTAAISTSFDLFSMAMGGLGAATGTASEKSVYSALAAFGVGARGSLSKNILAEQTTHAILQQMEAMRLSQESLIRRNLKNFDDQRYPLHAALTDLFDYYTAGSVKDAVSELAKSAQTAKDRAQKELEKAMGK